MSGKDAMVSELIGLALELVRTRTPASLSLDELGEIIGDRAISPPQIDLVISQLETEGVAVGGDQYVDLTALLRTVIQTALVLKKNGRPASALAIAEASGLSHGSVKLALLYSEVIRKPN